MVSRSPVFEMCFEMFRQLKFGRALPNGCKGLGISIAQNLAGSPHASNFRFRLDHMQSPQTWLRIDHRCSRQLSLEAAELQVRHIERLLKAQLHSELASQCATLLQGVADQLRRDARELGILADVFNA